MSTSCLSFDLLGQVGPVLAWVEGTTGSRLPATWTTASVPIKTRERDWLQRELPTYSYDNIHEIVRGTREHHSGHKRAPTPNLDVVPQPELSPPPGYDLIDAFRQLNGYFLSWNGTEPSIAKGRMEELHELAIRIPVGHVIRHSHARVVSEGVLKFEEALLLPELVTLLPSNSFGLRSVIRQGLSESHLHLKGVISAEEKWADNLLRPFSASAIRVPSEDERRLLVLNFFAGRLLALAVWFSLVEADEDLPVRPRRLLRFLDQIYFARSPWEERWATQRFEEAMAEMIYGYPGDHPRRAAWRERHENDKNKKEVFDRELHRPEALLNRPLSPADQERYGFLLRWMAPGAFHGKTLRNGQVLPGSFPEGLQERYEFVHKLHLGAHLRLVQLTSRDRQREAGHEERQKERKKRLGQSAELDDPRRYFLHEALFRYLVCRTHHWQLATQQGRTTGLSYFREFYGSSQRKMEDLSDLQYAELVFERLRRWRGLRVLEGRVSPPESPQKLVPWILAYARPEDRRIQKFGMVVHFKKEDEGREDPTFRGEIPAPVPRLRWGKRRRLIREEAKRLYRLLQKPTPITPFVVGIDACNLELSTPPEVFAPIFRYLRELPIPVSGANRRYAPYFELDQAIRRLGEKRRLGMTYHVGEDFRHLLSGLRAICEVVDFLAPKPGDRLGHGTALALQPEDWLEHNDYQAVMPKLEWLDTLVWVHHFLGPGDNLVGELSIEDEIQRASWEIYGKAVGGVFDPLGLELKPRRRGRRKTDNDPPQRGLLDWDWSPLVLWDAWKLRQLDPYSVDLPGLLRGRLELRPLRSFSEEDRRWFSVQERVLREIEGNIGSRNAYILLALYWISPEVRKEGNKVKVVNMKEQRSLWLELCCRVEDKMKQLIHEKELVVEVNPSSNRIIGPMERYQQHHVFHLTLDASRRLSRHVRVSVNTDNPAVCNTTLAHEYYLLGEILIEEGVPEAEVVTWLEWLRKNGEDYNFVRRLRSPEEDPDMGRLVEWLRKIRPSVREARTRGAKLDAFWCWLRDTRLRSHGFDRVSIERARPNLERLLALENKVSEWRRLARHTGAPEGLEERLERIEKELAEVAWRTGVGPQPC